MARVNFNPTTTIDWKEIATEYIAKKAEEKEITDRTKELNSKLKSFLEGFDNKEDQHIDTDNSGVYLTYRTKDVWDEDRMIELLKNKNLVGNIVKTKEYIDFDALESALYNETLPKDVLKELAKCKSEVVTSVLNIKKYKKGE